jgi:hypothetical protein
MRKLFPGLFVLVGLAVVVFYGFEPDGYMVHVRRLPPPYPYPFEGVAFFCGVLLLEAALLWSILRPNSYSQSWGRAGCACLLAASLAVMFALGSMHTPPYYYAHFLWLVAVFSVLIILFIWSLAAKVMRHAP